MQIDPNDLDRRERYHLMIACVVPRPIGWVSSVDEAGRPNLAPFSFFNGVSADPPIVMVSVGKKRGGVRKDTANNILATREAVVHIPHRPLAEQMVRTSIDAAPDVDEIALAELTPVTSQKILPPRVAEAAIAFETKLHAHHEIGHGPMDVLYLEVVHIHLADAIVTDGLPDLSKLDLVGRLGGAGYCDTSARFDIARP